ncbi:MAG: YrdB family protein [Planctomycetota bacterium]|jgi:hypothetical protein
MDAPRMAGWNLTLRFGLELGAIFAIGTAGYHAAEDWSRHLLAVGLPIAAMVVWGLFNVADDPSRSGNAPIPVPGLVRLAVEIAILTAGAYSFYFVWDARIAVLFCSLVVLHYIASWRRVAWLLRQ